MKFYVATSFDNKAQQRELVALLEALGPGWRQTCDWTKNEHYRDEAHRADLAAADLEGVRAADLVVVLLPGGMGTHVELGYALALRDSYVEIPMPGAQVQKRVVVWSWDGSHFADQRTPPFYHAPGVERVTGPLVDLVDYLR